jgi:spermidine synthase
VLDAFSSDAIPVHLLTREAFALYERILAPGGIMAVHVSNRHVDLQPVIARIAADAGLVAGDLPSSSSSWRHSAFTVRSAIW